MLFRSCAGGSTTLFNYGLNGFIQGEYSNDGTPIQETVWLSDIPVAVFRGVKASEPAFYIYADNLNTPRQIMNNSVFIEKLLSVIFFLISFILFYLGVEDAVSNSYMAVYKIAVCFLFAAGGGHPFAAIQLALGKVTFKSSSLSYSRFARALASIGVLILFLGSFF